MITCTCLLRSFSRLYCCRSWLISSESESSIVLVLCVVGKFEYAPGVNRARAVWFVALAVDSLAWYSTEKEDVNEARGNSWQCHTSVIARRSRENGKAGHEVGHVFFSCCTGVVISSSSVALCFGSFRLLDKDSTPSSIAIGEKQRQPYMHSGFGLVTVRSSDGSFGFAILRWIHSGSRQLLEWCDIERELLSQLGEHGRGERSEVVDFLKPTAFV